jgi:GNAT superfamily N-acetyltransferase
LSFTLRNAGPADLEFLEEMLGWAASWRSAEIDAELLAQPAVSRYVDGFPREGDAGVVAEDELGRPIGAAWYRFFTETEPGFGFVAPDIPELTVAVSPGSRNKGVGTALLHALVAEAQREGVFTISLSVEEGNSAVRIYERLGFRSVESRDGAMTMRLGARATAE